MPRNAECVAWNDTQRTSEIYLSVATVKLIIFVSFLRPSMLAWPLPCFLSSPQRMSAKPESFLKSVCEELTHSTSLRKRRFQQRSHTHMSIDRITRWSIMRKRERERQRQAVGVSRDWHDVPPQHIRHPMVNARTYMTFCRDERRRVRFSDGSDRAGKSKDVSLIDYIFGRKWGKWYQYCNDGYL